MCKLPGTYDCPNCLKLIPSYCEGMAELGKPVDEDKKCKCQIATWDFQTALGDTIREKYESQYVKIVEVTNVVNRKIIRMNTQEVKKALTPTPRKRKYKWTFEGFDSKGNKVVGPEFVKMVSRPNIPKPLEGTWVTSILFYGQKDDKALLQNKLKSLEGGYGTLKLYDAAATRQKVVDTGGFGQLTYDEEYSLLIEECDLDYITIKKMATEDFPDGYDLTLHMDCAAVYHHNPFGDSNEAKD